MIQVVQPFNSLDNLWVQIQVVRISTGNNPALSTFSCPFKFSKCVSPLKGLWTWSEHCLIRIFCVNQKRYTVFREVWCSSERLANQKHTEQPGCLALTLMNQLCLVNQKQRAWREISNSKAMTLMSPFFLVNQKHTEWPAKSDSWAKYVWAYSYKWIKII